MIRTSLINGVINLDSDFSKYIESLSKPGVIEGLNVQDGVVKPGKARVKAERTNGETIYCYVENTEDVSLSGNDGKVYIVIDQEDIDSGLVSEDGLNIARIEEGTNRPEKNFLKLWSKNGGLIIDERDIIKKIDEVNEDIEDEISGIDTRLTEAEHDIQQIIEQSGSALSYLDKTCYAGEEIHENDLIVTNGNSFNPDRTDESTDVGGQTVNKYAIGFVGNGESTDTFSIKTSVIEGYEPDSVTINIESDDNGKPSGTALATSTSLDVFKLRTDPANTTSSSISNLYAFYMNTLGEGEGKISYDNSNKVMSISGTRYNYTLDLSSFFPNNTPGLHYKTRDDKYFIFYEAFNKYWLLYLPTPTTIDGATIQNIDSSIIFNGTGLSSDSTLRGLCISDNGNYMFAYAGNFSQSDRKIFKIKLTTPFIVNTYDSFEELTLEYSPYNGNLSIINNFGKNYFVYTKYASSGSQTYAQLCELDDNYTIISQNNTGKFSGTQIIPDYRATQTRFYGGDNELLFGYDRDYNGVYKGTITTTTTFDSVKGTKYRLTIAPVKTGSVVDCVKIYDKEGEYYSECAVRDLNSWSNVANKTPYIDSSCILARYARKANSSDILTDIPCGFANGDFTELENVQYTFQGLKTGFNGLAPDTLYYYDGAGGITTEKKGIVVGKAVNENGLLFSPTRTVNSPFSITSTGGNKTITAMCDETALIMGEGSLTVTGDTTFSHPVSNSHYFVYMKGLKKGKVYTFQVSGYTSGSTTHPGEATITFY